MFQQRHLLGPVPTTSPACIALLPLPMGAKCSSSTKLTLCQCPQQVGFAPELAYALAACRYRGGDLSSAAAALADVVQAGVQLHPELGIGTQTEGMEVSRGVGCTPARCADQVAEVHATEHAAVVKAETHHSCARPHLRPLASHASLLPHVMQARSVGNSTKLKATALVEAFNLRAAIELAMGNPAGGPGEAVQQG